MAPAMPALTPRWHPAKLSPMQLGYLNSTSQINLVRAGRRSFKTEAAKRRLVSRAITFSAYPDGHFFACAPTWDQAKKVFWSDLKALTPTWALAGQDRRNSISNGELWIQYANGALLSVVGLDKPQRMEGVDCDGAVITEYGNCRAWIFDEVIRPMLMRGGWCDIEGVPEGRNHYYDLYCEIRDGRRPRAVQHFWTTEEVLHLWLGEEQAAEEIADAKTSMDRRLYEQEYLAEWVTLEGMAYYAYDRDVNAAVGDRRALYDPTKPLILCFDFNRNPGVCAYVQEQDPARFPWLTPSPKYATVTAVIGEVFIRRNSNTRKVCEQIISDWAGIHTDDVLYYGDATGGAKGSSSVEGSDWEIIRQMLRPVFGHKLKNRVEKANPPVRARINAMNSRLASMDGCASMVIDAKGAPSVIRDLEGVETDDAGEIVKEDDSPLTHISDALGYYITEKFPAGGQILTTVTGV